MLCRKVCGFFGSRSTMNLCSKCYKDNVARALVKSIAQDVEEAAAKRCDTVQDVEGAGFEGKLQQQRQQQQRQQLRDASKDPQRAGRLRETECQHALVAYANKCGFFGNRGTVNLCSKCFKVMQQPNRCFTCRKRVGLTGFKCRCGSLLCAMHRYSDKHDCSFDFKAMGRDAIAKALGADLVAKPQKRR